MRQPQKKKKNEFDGTLILERLAQMGKLDEFYEAVDSDHFEKLERLMRKMGYDSETIQLMMDKIANGLDTD